MTLAVALVVVVILQTTPAVHNHILLADTQADQQTIKNMAALQSDSSHLSHAAPVAKQPQPNVAVRVKPAKRAVAPKHELTQLDLRSNFKVESKDRSKQDLAKQDLVRARKEAEMLAKDVSSAEKSAHSVQAKKLPSKISQMMSKLTPVQLERNRMKAIEVMEEATLKKRERENQLAEHNMKKLTVKQKQQLEQETKDAQGALQKGLDDEHLALKWEHEAQKEHDSMVLAKQKALDYSEDNKGKLSNAKYEQIRATTQLAEASEDMRHAQIDLRTSAKDRAQAKAEQAKAKQMKELVTKQRKAVAQARHRMDALELRAEKAQQQVEGAKVDLMQAKRHSKKHPGLVATAKAKLKMVERAVRQSGVLQDEHVKTKMYQTEERLLDKLETRQVEHKEKSEHQGEFAIMSKDKAKRLTEEAFDAQNLAARSRHRAEKGLTNAQKALILAKSQHTLEESLVGRYVQERRQAKRYENEADKHFATSNKISLAESSTI